MYCGNLDNNEIRRPRGSFILDSKEDNSEDLFKQVWQRWQYERRWGRDETCHLFANLSAELD